MRRAIVLLALSALLLPAVYAQGKGKGKAKGHNKSESAPGTVSVTVFRPEDRSVITTYYRSPGNLPPGLAKRDGDLPPGLEKQLRRNGRLPPGLDKRLAPFSPEIEARLPPCPPDVRRGLIGGTAVMWNTRTGLILDAWVAIRL